MKITIDSVIRVKDIPADILKHIKAELTIKNPEYVKKRAMGLNRWAWGQEFIKLWNEKVINGVKECILPRGYWARLWDVTRISWMDIEDKRFKLPYIEFPNEPKLRDYQVPVLELAEQWEQGCVIMPCGSGKTETAMGIVARLMQPTLWITHTMDLLQQSMDRAVRRLGLSADQVGLVQGNNMRIGTHMTFATVQTLSKRDLSRIRERFGCIVVDEAHLVFKNERASCMFESVISQFPAYYRFGITASEYRSDGLIETMFHIIGPKFYEVEQDDSRLSVMKPRVEFIETEFQYDQEENEEGEKRNLIVQQMLKAMREDDKREKIVGKILREKIVKGDYCLVLGDSLEHLKYLCGYVRSLGRDAAYVCGNTPKKDRQKIMAAMRQGQYQYLFATYQLAKLGLDIPRLNKLVYATPKRDKTSIQQAVGRIMRPEEGKEQPVVYDLWDKKVKQCVFWARDRSRVYRKLGCEIVGGPKIRRF